MNAVANTLAERGGRYGQFADHARIAQGVQDVMRAAPKWHQLDQDMKQALSVIADKIARILNGDPYYGDNWHDIQGYAKLIEDRINMIVDEPTALYAPDETQVYYTPGTEPVVTQAGYARNAAGQVVGGHTPGYYD